MMKRKKLIAIASVLVSTCIFTACSSANTQVTFKDYWFSNPNTMPTNVEETLTYSVTYEKSSTADDNSFALEYTSGTYVTKLTINEDQQYVYETTLTMVGSYTYGSQTEAFEDTNVTKTVFAKDAKLSPISSYKKIDNHTPVSSATAEKYFSRVQYTVETTYDEGLTGGTCKVTNDATGVSTDQSFTIDDKYTYLDNEQLLFALRGLSQTSSSSFYVYAPFTKKVQTVKATFGSLEEGSSFSYEKNGTMLNEAIIDYYPVTVAIDAKTSGALQSVWIAEMSDPQANEHRNVILQMQTSVAYNLGTLTYKLTNASFVS